MVPFHVSLQLWLPTWRHTTDNEFQITPFHCFFHLACTFSELLRLIPEIFSLSYLLNGCTETANNLCTQLTPISLVSLRYSISPDVQSEIYCNPVLQLPLVWKDPYVFNCKNIPAYQRSLQNPNFKARSFSVFDLFISHLSPQNGSHHSPLLKLNLWDEERLRIFDGLKVTPHASLQSAIWTWVSQILIQHFNNYSTLGLIMRCQHPLGALSYFR